MEPSRRVTAEMRTARRAALVSGKVGPVGLVDQLVTKALLLALDPDVHPPATELARLADDHPRALDVAVARLVRREQGRPSRVKEAATESLRLARNLGPGSADGPAQGEGRYDRASGG